MNSHISLQFLGGTADGMNLTGSATLITIHQQKEVVRILVDAGMVQTGAKKFFPKNREILEEIDPSKIDFIFLTHSHTDHIGRVPFLVEHGFKGRIITTDATAEFLPTMWKDSMNIQDILSRSLASRIPKIKQNKERDKQRSRMALGKYDRQKEKSKRIERKNDYTPLYSLNSINKALSLVKNNGYGYGKWHRLEKKIQFKFYPSGHVLGGAVCLIRVQRVRENNVVFGFSGDLGRSDGVILPPPKVPKERIDYWCIESTYGNKVHPSRDEEIEHLLKIIRFAHQNKKRVLIPSFALERTQEILYLLSYHMQIRNIPMVPIYLDSPMAAELTKVFADHWDEGLFSDQAQSFFNPFDPHKNYYLQIISGHKESQHFCETNDKAAIVIAGAGMCEAGRIRNYLRYGLSDPETIVCLVGYMAEGTLGRKLKNGVPIIKMNGKEIYVKAKIVDFDSFSAHADQSFLISYTKSIVDIYHKDSSDDKFKQTIFLLHGEEQSSEVLRNEFFRAFPRKGITSKIHIPRLNKIFVIDEDD